MEDKKEVVDSGIIGFSEAEDLQKQLEEKNKKIIEIEKYLIWNIDYKMF